jgi:hypothetical protein
VAYLDKRGHDCREQSPVTLHSFRQKLCVLALVLKGYVNGDILHFFYEQKSWLTTFQISSSEFIAHDLLVKSHRETFLTCRFSPPKFVVAVAGAIQPRCRPDASHLSAHCLRAFVSPQDLSVVQNGGSKVALSAYSVALFRKCLLGWRGQQTHQNQNHRFVHSDSGLSWCRMESRCSPSRS